MEPARFVLLGADHLVALAATASAAAAAVALVRRRPEAAPARAVRFGLAALLLSGTAGYIAVASAEGTLSPWDFLPLHLCDFAIFLAAYALLTLHRRACELLYFWACGGTVLAMVTPEVWYGFPDWRCLAYFGMHGGVVVAALTLTFGFGLRPGAGAPWRAFLWTNAYAAFVGLMDVVFGANYLYLRGKPSTPTVLDWFGPWPHYLLVCEAVALSIFFLLGLPFRPARSRRP